MEELEKAWLTRNNRSRCSQYLDQPRWWSSRKLDDHHLQAPLHSINEWNCCRDLWSSNPLMLSSCRIPDSGFLRQAFTPVQRYFSAYSFVRLFGNIHSEIRKVDGITTYSTRKSKKKLTITTRSLMVCSIRVPYLSGVIHCCPGAFRMVVYLGVRIFEAEDLCHPYG